MYTYVRFSIYLQFRGYTDLTYSQKTNNMLQNIGQGAMAILQMIIM